MSWECQRLLYERITKLWSITNLNLKRLEELEVACIKYRSTGIITTISGSNNDFNPILNYLTDKEQDELLPKIMPDIHWDMVKIINEKEVLLCRLDTTPLSTINKIINIFKNEQIKPETTATFIILGIKSILFLDDQSYSTILSEMQKK